MKNLQNLHTHSTFCDGKDTPEEMVKIAIAKGFDSLGFSGHALIPEWYTASAMSAEKAVLYFAEIERLKVEYEGKIDIFLGMEYDTLSEISTYPLDYSIGSTHYMKWGEKHGGVDHSPEESKYIIDDAFGGDGMAFVKGYYSLLATLPERGKFDILGHIDLITKFKDKVTFFDEEDPEYFRAAAEAISALKGKIPFFEVNTGAIGRGHRKTPYPSLKILKELKNQGFKAIISSDCHNGQFLDVAFSDAADLLEAGGFKERYILTKSGFKAVELR